MIELNLTNRAPRRPPRATTRPACSNGVPLGATSTGLYQINGYTDHNVSIPALIKSGSMDFGVENKKRFRFFLFWFRNNWKFNIINLWR